MVKRNVTSEELKERENLIHRAMVKSFSLIGDVLGPYGVNASKIKGKYEELYDTLSKHGDEQMYYVLAPASLGLTAQAFTFNDHGDNIKRSFKQFFDLIREEELLEKPGVFEKLGTIKRYEKQIQKLFDLEAPLSEVKSKSR